MMSHGLLNPRTTMHARRGAARRGVTLLELLVVVVIVGMLTAAAIPVILPALEGRRLRESARSVNSFISGAHSRAMLTGRPVAVVFERMPGVPSASIQLSYAEVPPPYAGDFAGSRIAITNGQITGFSNNDIGWAGLLRPGNVVQLGYQGRRYRLVAGEPFFDKNYNGQDDMGEYHDIDGNGGYTPPSNELDPATGSFAAPPMGIWSLIAEDSVLAATVGLPGTSAIPPDTPAGGLPFQILRQPEPSAFDMLILPDSIVVDLGWSGLNTLTAGGNDTWRFLPDSNNAPVMVVFNPTGTVSEIYSQPPSGGAWGTQKPLGLIYFLVGRRELAPMNAIPNAEPENNLEVVSNLWVVVNPRTGLVATVEQSVPDHVEDSTGTSTLNLAEEVIEHRSLAAQARAMGGR